MWNIAYLSPSVIVQWATFKISNVDLDPELVKCENANFQ